MRRMGLSYGATLVAGLVFVFAAGCEGDKPAAPKAGAGSAPGGAGVSFEKDVMPLFARSCGVCHRREGGNEHAIEDGKFYETKADVLGNVGKFIIPGEPDKSGLVKVCDQTYPVGDHKIVMPPPESGVQKFSAADIELFKKWIAEGAKDN